ncbi:MAG: 6-phosphogluconolactonase [Bacteroidota bacterium]|nr:6-phosphogluconolactonase [Bacteroidota bacterium]
MKTMKQQKNPMVLIWKDLNKLSNAAAYFFVWECNRSIAKNGKFTVAFSGGNTPKKLYELLASPAFSRNISWKNVFIFWSDERFVPHNDAESNYNMAKENLLQHISIPEENIYPIPTNGTTKKCARQYEKTMRKFFKPGEPRFDFLLLGIGNDGHTASLFPGTDILKEKKQWIKESIQPGTNAPRISFTLPLIRQAKQIVFLVSGAEKADIISRIFSKNQTKKLLPVQMIPPIKGNITWMLDEKAGLNLPGV